MFETADPCETPISEISELESQIDIVPWSELVRHFAFGRLYVVREPWNLLEAGRVVKCDDAARLKQAMENSEFGQPTDSEASHWHETTPIFKVLVLDPFVLVQLASLSG